MNRFRDPSKPRLFEIETRVFNENRHTLDGKEGSYVVIHQTSILGTFPTAAEGLRAGYAAFGPTRARWYSTSIPTTRSKHSAAAGPPQSLEECTSTSPEWAYIKGTSIAIHASEVREGEEYELNGVRVYPVMKQFFRYEANRADEGHAHEVSSNPRESAAHIVTKSLLVEFGRLYCMVGGEPVLLRLRDVQMEQRLNKRTPDITGIVNRARPIGISPGIGFTSKFILKIQRVMNPIVSPR